MSEVLLKKSQCIPFLATAAETGSTGTVTYTWTRIDKSTKFTLNPNPQTEKMDYICWDAPKTEVDHYEPELPQEIRMAEENPMYDFIFDKFWHLPVGDACVVPCLICFPGSDKNAWLVKEATLVLGEMDTIGKKISFTINLGGDITLGTYTITGGVPAFTESNE